MTETLPPKPLPEPNDLTRPFWDFCRKHELRIQRCVSCGKLIHYPKIICPHDHGTEFDWVKVSGRGTVYSFVGAYRAFHPAFQPDLPYTIAIVELEEGPHMMTNVLAHPEKVSIGMKVEVAFEDVNEEISLPKFRPAGVQ